MKVLLINKFHYIKGGSETYYFGLGDLLKRNGVEVVYFAMKDEKNFPCAQEPYFVENVDFNKPMSKPEMAKAGMKMLYSFEAKKKLEQLIEAEKPDVAHINLFQSQLTGSIVDVLYAHHIPIVYTMHDLKPVCPTYLMLSKGKICSDCKAGNYLPCIKKHCMKNSLTKSILAAAEAELYHLRKTYDKMDVIITPSDYHKKQLERAGLTKPKIVRIRNFLPENIRFVETSEVGSYFLYFGRLSEEKGIRTLLKAIEIAQLNSPFYFVGRGPLEEEVSDFIKSHRLEGKVKTLGFKQGEELQEIVRKSKCVVLPSECSENAPYSIMEAMAAARPVIVSRNGGLPEIVEDGVSGYISEPGNPQSLADRMKKIENSTEEQLREMGKKSQAFAAQNANPQSYMEQMLKLYQQCISKKEKQQLAGKD